MKAKDALLLNNTITQNPNLARRAFFWHVSSHLSLCHVTMINSSHWLRLHGVVTISYLTVKAKNHQRIIYKLKFKQEQHCNKPKEFYFRDITVRPLLQV